MINKNITAILILVLIMSLQNLSGQAPANMTDQLTHKFQDYVSSVPREEIYIHSDRDAFISGEDMWFSIYLIDRQSLKPSSESKIAYFELLNPDNRPIVQKKLWLMGGYGPGHIVLPDTLTTGTYTIRAYTSWMKNFLPYNCFSMEVHVYNSFSSRTFKKKNGIENYMNNTGNQAFTSFDNKGVTLKADNLKPDILDIFIQSDDNFRSQNNNLVYLFIQTHGNIDRVSTERLTSEDTKISVSKKQLNPGINQITIFNIKGQPVGEKYIYTSVKSSAPLTIQCVDSSGPRRKISIGLELEDVLNREAGLSNFSISVTPGTNDHFKLDLDDYMIFGTEFASSRSLVVKNKKANDFTPEEIDNLLQNVKSNWINWDSILADNLPDFKYPMEKEYHSISGRLLSGDKKTGDAGKFVLLSIPGKTAGFQYARTNEQGGFSFNLHIDEKIKDLIIVPDIISKSQSINIESPFSDQYFKSDLNTDTTIKTIPDYISVMSVNYQVRKLYGANSVKDSLYPVIPVPRIKRFYGKPDDELKLKDYIALPVMQEVFFELLAGVTLKSKKTGYEITINSPDNSKPYESSPGLFIDGVAIKDASLIASLEPDVVDKIDVVRSKYYIGDYLFYGIVNVITKAADFNNLQFPDNSVRLPYRAIDQVNPFLSPDYSSPDKRKSRIPDFRNTLYWNPSVTPDNSGKASVNFWTSDFISDFVVNIQGFTADGKAVSVKKIIKVRK
jgi:hypothetical protein